MFLAFYWCIQYNLEYPTQNKNTSQFKFIIPSWSHYFQFIIFDLHQLFPAFICAYNIGSLVNCLLGVRIFNSVPVFFLFWGYNFILSAIVFFGSNFTSSSRFNGDSGGKLSSSKSRIKISGLFRTFTLFYELSESLLYWVVYIFKILTYSFGAVLITTFIVSLILFPQLHNLA